MSIAIIGLTGQTGAGKSTIADWLRGQGHAVIDCDRVARSVASPKSKCLAALENAFSSDILLSDGSLNRSALGHIVFSDSNKLALLNDLIFPFITKAIRAQIQVLEQDGAPLVLLDAPTLFESGVDRLCRAIISVTAKEEIRLERIRERDHLSREDALLRMHSQLDEAFFRAHSDLIIENNGAAVELEEALQNADRYLHSLPNG